MRKNEAEQFDRLLAAHQKWQMATILLLDELNELGVDMRWVFDAGKKEIVEEILRRNRRLGFKDHGEGI